MFGIELEPANSRERLVIEIRHSDIERELIHASLDFDRGQTADDRVGMWMTPGEGCREQ